MKLRYTVREELENKDLPRRVILTHKTLFGTQQEVVTICNHDWKEQIRLNFKIKTPYDDGVEYTNLLLKCTKCGALARHKLKGRIGCGDC